MHNLFVETNIGKTTISKKQAHYFAVQIFSEMKKYISDHQTEFAEWCDNQEEETNDFYYNKER